MSMHNKRRLYKPYVREPLLQIMADIWGVCDIRLDLHGAGPDAAQVAGGWTHHWAQTEWLWKQRRATALENKQDKVATLD